MIEIYNLKKSFNNKMILNNLNLKIKDGSIFGLIGPNGAGKSTLLRLLTGIIKADDGNILYDGIDVYDNVDIKKDILLISDNPYYFSYATISKMKEFYQVWYPNFDLNVYYKVLNCFGLSEFALIKDFSKGMKRQAILTIAFAIGPKYLFLDEAFDGLDPFMRLNFKRLINELMATKEMTIIISSHNLRELEDICDSFGILDNYQVETSGNIQEAKDNIHKIQLAYNQEIDPIIFSKLDVLSIKQQSRVINLVVKGDIDNIKTYLNTTNPLMIEILPVNLEEIFIYEISNRKDFL